MFVSIGPENVVGNVKLPTRPYHDIRRPCPVEKHGVFQCCARRRRRRRKQQRYYDTRASTRFVISDFTRYSQYRNIVFISFYSRIGLRFCYVAKTYDDRPREPRCSHIASDELTSGNAVTPGFLIEHIIAKTNMV